ncbi:MAG: formyltransferase family protein [Saprospiraceae bacterium]|nr:hypothetical protein [Lewinella sp.]
MNRFCLASSKSWHKSLFEELSHRQSEKWILISDKKDLQVDLLHQHNIEKIFFPHWSYIIPKEVYTNFECIVFHMTDLPYGRGGSPLQNLIVRGHEETKISALRVSEGLDTGLIYLKSPLSLHGTAEEIFIRSTAIIKKMISQIIENTPLPQNQRGEVVLFKRRKPEDGNIAGLRSIDEIYDFIRMLDCEGYPPAFIETEHFKLEFSRASLKSDKSIIADVRIISK